MKPKFRVWDSLENKMRYDIGVIEFNGYDKQVNGLAFNYVLDDTGYNEVDNSHSEYYDANCFELMQSTNMKDINDKEIYEGDIVNVHHFTMGGSYDGAIEFDTLYINAIITYNKVEENGLYEWCIKTKDFEFPVNSLDGLHEESFHVVGNIYENPELLED